MLMFTSQQQAETRAAEERRREEGRAEERRREEARAEERRREMETERKEREIREERRRDDDRRDRDAADARRREEQIALMTVGNKRTELMVGALAAAMPVIGKLFEKKDDNTIPLLLKLSEKKDDPVTLMLLKSIMDKSHEESSTKNMIVQMGEMSKLGAQMSAEQMRSALQMNNEINQTMMKRVMDMAMASPQGSTPEGKGMIEQVMIALQGASEIVKTLVPSQPAALAAPAPRAHIAAPVAASTAAPATTEGAAPAAPSAPLTPEQQAEKEWAAMTPEQQAAIKAAQPKGIKGVLVALKMIQTKAFANQAEYQNLVQFLVSEMPLNLRVAVFDADQAGVIAICQPVIQETSELSTWIFQPGVLEQVQTFVAQLPPSLEAVYGPADAQRAQFAAETAAAAGAAAPVADAAPAPAGSEPIPGPGSVPAEAAPVATEPGAAAAESDGPQIPLPESSSTTTGSHLDPDAP